MNGLNVYDPCGHDTRQFLLAPSARGLPIFGVRLDIMKRVRDRTIPIILPSGKNILIDMVFTINIGHTNLNTSRVCLFITLNANMYP